MYGRQQKETFQSSQFIPHSSHFLLKGHILYFTLYGSDFTLPTSHLIVQT